jgi:hypothetical protein
MRIADFSRGWYPLAEPTRYPAEMGVASACLNVLFDRRTIRAREARILAATIPSSVKHIRSLFPYNHHHLSPRARIVAAFTDGSISATDNDLQQFPERIDLAGDRLSQTNIIRAAQHGRYQYYVDGESLVHRWAGGSSIGMVYQNVGIGPGPTVDEDSVYTGTTKLIYAVQITTAGARNDVTVDVPDGIVTGKFKWGHSVDGVTVGTGPVDIAENVTLDNGITLKWDLAEYQSGDTWHFRCLPVDTLETIEDGAAPKSVPLVKTFPNIALADCKTASITGEGPVPVAEDGRWHAMFLNAVTGFNGTAGYDFATAYAPTNDYETLCTRKLVQAANFRTGDGATAMEVAFDTMVANVVFDTAVWCMWKQGLKQSVDLSMCDKIQLNLMLATRQTGLTGGNVHLFVEFDSINAGQHLRNIREVPLVDSLLNTIDTALVDVSDIPAEQRSDIRWVALALYTGDSGGGLLYELAGRREADDSTYGEDFTGSPQYKMNVASTLVVDQMVGISSNRWFPSDEYQFLYTWGQWDGVTWVESPHSVIVNMVIPDETVALWEITIRADKSMGVGASDKINVYAIGGPLSAWRKIGDIFTKDTKVKEYVIHWQGQVDPDVDSYMPYVLAPPQGCGFIQLFRERMIYAKEDKIYISNKGEPRKVPQKALYELFDFYGATEVVGNEGGDVNAIGAVQRTAFLLKQQGVWMFTGDNAREWDLQQISHENGTVSPDSLAVYRGALMIWLDTSGDVYSATADGQIAPLGADETGKCMVGDFIRGLTSSQRATARGVADQHAKRYSLYFDSGSALTSTAVVYDFIAKSWTFFDQQPFGGVCEVVDAVNPGIYASDLLVAGSVYLLGHSTLPSNMTLDETTYICSWKSLVLQFEDAYQSLDRLIASLEHDSTGEITMELYRNIAAGAYASRAVAVDGFHQVAWQPALQDNAAQLQVGVEWEEDGAREREITALEARNVPRGGRYG